MLTCAGEEVVAVLVERHGHDSVRQIERLLDAVAVVYINVKVQHARMISATTELPAAYYAIYRRNRPTTMADQGHQ